MALWGAGLCPLHPPRLNLSGTGYPCRCGTRRGAGGLAPARHWLSLPLWYPAGGRGACPRAALAIPAAGVPGGGRGACPRAALAILAAVVPGGGQGSLPLAALARPAPGERTISNAEVPLPRSPLSLAAGTVYQYRVLTATPPVGIVNARRTGNAGGKPPTRYLLGRFCKCRGRLNAGDARGEAPCIKKPLSSPFPPGRGVGGMGAENQAKGKVGRRPKPPRPLRAPAPQV